MRTKKASDILRRIGGNSAELEAAAIRERSNLECASLIYEARVARGMTQAQLARAVGTSQPAIARLENADYGGRTVDMMHRIGRALGLRYVQGFWQPEPAFCVDAIGAFSETTDAACSISDSAANNNFAYAA